MKALKLTLIAIPIIILLHCLFFPCIIGKLHTNAHKMVYERCYSLLYDCFISEVDSKDFAAVKEKLRDCWPEMFIGKIHRRESAGHDLLWQTLDALIKRGHDGISMNEKVLEKNIFSKNKTVLFFTTAGWGDGIVGIIGSPEDFIERNTPNSEDQTWRPSYVILADGEIRHIESLKEAKNLKWE
ncbi:MAG: hypothetical protein AB7F23_10480 [Phycisphaerae bacterium]